MVVLTHQQDFEKRKKYASFGRTVDKYLNKTQTQTQKKCCCCVRAVHTDRIMMAITWDYFI